MDSKDRNRLFDLPEAIQMESLPGPVRVVTLLLFLKRQIARPPPSRCVEDLSLDESCETNHHRGN